MPLYKVVKRSVLLSDNNTMCTNAVGLIVWISEMFLTTSTSELVTFSEPLAFSLKYLFIRHSLAFVGMSFVENQDHTST